MKQDEARRKRLIKLIHVARRELRMADEDYRAMLMAMPALGGKTSSADLGVKGLELVLKALQAKGFKIRVKGPNTAAKAPSRKMADDAQSKLIRHLWLQLKNMGVLRNPSEEALAHYVKRITGIEDLHWLNNRQATSVIESLKSWVEREEAKP